MRFLPTRVHGVIDYLWGVALIATPWLFGFANGGAAQWVVYRPRLVRHRIACYAARAMVESWFCRTAAGVWNPCRSMSQVVL